VKENLETGIARRCPRKDATVPDTVFELFPVLKDMLSGAAATCRAASSSSSPSDGPLVMRPKVLVLDEPTEGIQPSIIKDIGRRARRVGRKQVRAHLWLSRRAR
jgi:urea transport system ATP-binding protein